MAVAERPQRPDPFSLSPRELLRNHVEIERLETIPLHRVIGEDSLIDGFHADELASSMRQKRGQITPIAVRARIDDDRKVVYDVIDGFHRAEGKRINKDKHVNATVIYGCSDEEMFDLRILAASSVRSVQFPRIAQWISQSWETTTWAQKGLKVASAFGLVMNNSNTSQKVNLSPQEITDLKEWARTKCARWGKSVSATYTILRLVENADPRLVREVRTSGGGKDRTGKITPARLEAVVSGFPGKPNFKAQRGILRAAVERRLSAEETQQLVRKMSTRVKPRMTEGKIYQSAKLIKIEQIEIGPKKPTQSHRPGAPRPERASVELDTKETIPELKARIKDLEEALKASRTKENKTETWWRTAVFLTPTERECMERIVYNEANEDFTRVCQSMDLTLIQAIGQIRSAFSKKQLEVEVQKLRESK